MLHDGLAEGRQVAGVAAGDQHAGARAVDVDLSSTQWPPALRMSVCRLGHDVSVLPSSTPASTRVQRRGIPRRRACRPRRTPWRIGPPPAASAGSRGWPPRRGGPARRTARARPRRPSIDRERVALVQVIEGLDLPLVGRDEHGLAAGVLHHLPRLGQLGLLDAFGCDEKSDLLACEVAGHSGPPARWGCRGPTHALKRCTRSGPSTGAHPAEQIRPGRHKPAKAGYVAGHGD